MDSKEASENWSQCLAGIDKSDYGDLFRAHALEQYKLYVQFADKISDRRQTANSFFLTINTAIIGFLGATNIVAGTNEIGVWRLALITAGLAICYYWYRLIESYRNLNDAKFKVVHEIEKRLPMKPYDAEWECVGRGRVKKLYYPFTHLERSIPWVFQLLYFILLIISASQYFPLKALIQGACRWVTSS